MGVLVKLKKNIFLSEIDPDTLSNPGFIVCRLVDTSI